MNVGEVGERDVLSPGKGFVLRVQGPPKKARILGHYTFNKKEFMLNIKFDVDEYIIFKVIKIMNGILIKKINNYEIFDMFKEKTDNYIQS